MRHIIIDLHNGEENELFGKDLALTDAPKNILKEVSLYIKTSTYTGLSAEEFFIKKITDKGYSIKLVDSLDNMESYIVSADNY